MKERERLSLRAHRQEIEAAERAEREAHERPIREAEEKLKATHRELLKIQRENIAKLRDDEIYVSPNLKNASMSQADADAFNTKQVNLFIQTTEEYTPYRATENAAELLAYFDRNGIGIFDSDMLRAAFYRLRDLGLLTAREIAEPQPEPIPAPASELDAEIAAPAPETFEGWSLESGLPRLYSRKEVDRMDSLTYRKCFRLYKDTLTTPNIGPGPGTR